MKRIVSLVCSMFLLISSLTVSAAIDNTDPLRTNVERFLSESVLPDDVYSISDYDTVYMGQKVPTYLITDTEFRVADAQYYPIIADSSVIGLIGISNDNGNYQFSYTEGYNYKINSAMTENPFVAIINNGEQFEIINSRHNLLSLNSSIEYTNPTEKLIELNLKISTYLPNYFNLSVPKKLQSTNWDCWSACAASLGQYYNNGKVYTSIQVGEMINHKTYGYARDVIKALYDIYGVVVSTRAGSPDLGDLMLWLYDYEAPTIAGIYYGGDAGHMVVIDGWSSGTSYTALRMMDPASGYMTVSITAGRYIEFIYNGLDTFIIDHINRRLA